MKALSMLFLLLTALPGDAQLAKGHAKRQWWISPTSSPLSLRMGPHGRYVDLVNTSQDVVTDYAFGCVVQIPKGYNIEKIFPDRKDELPPTEVLSVSTDWYLDEYVSKCTRTAKLAVVKIVFSNGSEWTLRSGWDRRSQR